MFGIRNARTELKIYKVEKGDQGTEVYFKQFYKGLETSKDYGISTHFTPDGKLKNVSGTFYPDIALSPIPRISKAEALKIAKLDFDSQNKGVYRNPAPPSLMVFSHKGKYYLAWFIYFYRWRYFVDANTGKIIEKDRLPIAF